MCSIIGFHGSHDAAPVIVKGLKRMEYRGYDSVGVATSIDSGIQVRKGVGRVDDVDAAYSLHSMQGNTGIGHTRWATHGSVTRENAHPHLSNSKKIAIVHNGIVDNFEEIKGMLLKAGYSFSSQTDTEVIANLLQYNHERTGGIKETMIKTLSQIKGDYAFVAVFEGGVLAAARRQKPLIIGADRRGYFLSSDVLGFIETTDNAIYVENENFVIIDDKLAVFDFAGVPKKFPITKISKEFADAYKGEFAHHTLKEISEQAVTIPRAGQSTEDAIRDTVDSIRDARRVYITGSGTSYNAALVAKHVIQRYAGIHVEPVMASEFPHAPDIIGEDTVFIAVSQSGESADVLEAVRIAKSKGARVLSIINLLTSSLAHESSINIAMNCGPEIGVAATKSFTAQLAIIYRICNDLCGGCMNLDFAGAADGISGMLDSHDDIQDIAVRLKEISDIYVLGRGLHHPIAMEAALKLKEMTYIHAEGIPGGELKHGPLALMDDNVYAIILNPQDSTYNDTLTSAREIKARNAKIIGVSDVNSDVYDHWIRIPRMHEHMYPMLEVVAMQLLAYYAALEKDTNPDYPRNLAKSVTVR